MGEPEEIEDTGRTPEEQLRTLPEGDNKLEELFDGMG